MIRSDMHTHTDLSGDCQSPIEVMLESAKQKGLKYYAVTDHHDIDYPEGPLDFTLDLTRSTDELKQYKETNTDDFQLIAGIEYGLQPYLKDDLLKLSASSNYDFIIGSCHLAQGIDPYEKRYFHHRSRNEGYLIYFEAILQCITEMHGFDALGHMDYAIRYWRGKGERQYSYHEFSDVLDAILETVIRKDIALEVNTAGYPHKLGQPHPSYEVLTRYHQMGGELLTIGSDAHIPKNIAIAFDTVEENLKKIGFKSYTIFKNRQPIQLGW